jgi:hypothetical protein
MEDGMQKQKPFIIGSLSSVGLLVFWFLVLTVTESFDHALKQFVEIGVWIVILAIGFGLQVALFTFIRKQFRVKNGKQTAEVATSGGVSAGTMVVCCAHHFFEILPVLGLSTAAVFLVKYQTPFFFLGIFSNMIGISMMLLIMQRHGFNPGRSFFKHLFSLNMRRVRNVTLMIATLAIAISFTLTAVNTTAEDQSLQKPLQSLKTVINDEKSVSIEVTPIEFSFDDNIRFEVTINTHQGDLDFDLTDVVLLEDDLGNKFKPVGWDGSPSGGHHRSGFLTFSNMDYRMTQMKLTIFNVYDVPERVFEWELK